MLNNDLKLIAVHDDVLHRIASIQNTLSDISLTPGPQGPAGKDGKDGRDGVDGKDGKDGVDGRDGVDGADGADGVGVEDARIDFDGHLVLVLTDGNELDCGEIAVGEAEQHFHVSMGGSGSSDQLSGYVDINQKGFVARFTASTNLSAGQVCRLNSSGEMALADATSESTCSTLMGLAVADIASGEVGSFLLRGFYGAAGFGTGDVVYADTTAGGITDFKPSNTGNIVRVLGYAISPSQIFFDPDKTWIELA